MPDFDELCRMIPPWDPAHPLYRKEDWPHDDDCDCQEREDSADDVTSEPH